MEYKQFPFEIRAVTEDGVIKGYASTFGNKDSYGDVIEAGAFEKTLKRNGKNGLGVKFLWQHFSDDPIGYPLSIEEDKRGLKFAGQLILEAAKGFPDTPAVPSAHRAFALAKAKAVNAFSIGFTIPKGGAEYDEDGNQRTIKQIDLWEVSLVTFPANPKARVTGVKNAETVRDLERALRDVGLSWSEAKFLASHHRFVRDDDDGVLVEILKDLQSLKL